MLTQYGRSYRETWTPSSLARQALIHKSAIAQELLYLSSLNTVIRRDRANISSKVFDRSDNSTIIQFPWTFV